MQMPANIVEHRFPLGTSIIRKHSVGGVLPKVDILKKAFNCKEQARTWYQNDNFQLGEGI